MPSHRRARFDWAPILILLAILSVLAAIAVFGFGGSGILGQPPAKTAVVKTAQPVTPALGRTLPLAAVIVLPAKTPQINSKGLTSSAYPSYRIARENPSASTSARATATSTVPMPSATSKAPTPTPTPTITPSTPTPSASSPPTSAPATTPSATST